MITNKGIAEQRKFSFVMKNSDKANAWAHWEDGSGDDDKKNFNPQKFDHVLKLIVKAINKSNLFPGRNDSASIFSSEIITDSSFEFQEYRRKF